MENLNLDKEELKEASDRVAKTLLKANVDYEDIQQLSGKTIEEIQELEKTLKEES